MNSKLLSFAMCHHVILGRIITSHGLEKTEAGLQGPLYLRYNQNMTYYVKYWYDKNKAMDIFRISGRSIVIKKLCDLVQLAYTVIRPMQAMQVPVYLLTSMDRATLFNAKSTISHCTPSLVTRLSLIHI